ncbi:DNA repair protein RadC [Cytobacillus depressus]|uniref:DNA repair protein RadC n=1 Tax=Cytobacillus depressus TaxID=1602942 RepID=A0A6L3UY67_9BACI|nr:JAB domain-containing protein [Cytobacillus depressus]KAB2328950.1 DNA repair protein RadC [Cytobacillus depressus]
MNFSTELQSKYPTKRYITEQAVVMEKVKGAMYHIPQRVTTPETAFHTIMGIKNLERETQEVFGVIALDTKHKVVGFDILHRGTINASIVHPRDIYKALLLRNAACFICFHNHPSGVPEPSYEDKMVTERLVEAGKLIGIELLDHIITGDDGKFFSFKEGGLM